jgi:hypothetical protein
VRAPLGDRMEARMYANSYGWHRTTDGTAGVREDQAVAMAAMLVRYEAGGR